MASPDFDYLKFRVITEADRGILGLAVRVNSRQTAQFPTLGRPPICSTTELHFHIRLGLC
jgi:hypothetical protein